MVRGGTLCLSKAGLAIGGTAQKVKIAAPNGAGVDYCINGLAYHKADADDVFTLSGDNVDDGYSCIFLMCLNSSGTASIVQGTSVLTADITSGKNALRWPQPTANTCAIGAVRVDTDGADFVPGTTALSAAEVTDTYYDFFAVPDTPITS